jgi:hypothetical protein
MLAKGMRYDVNSQESKKEMKTLPAGLEYLDKIRKMHCLVCSEYGEPHHLRPIGIGRKRKNEMLEHYTVIPLCRKHHTEIHTIGIEQFNLIHRIDVWREAFRLVIGV